MRLPFLNRTREISKLARALASPEPSFVVIYGRRRFGKSTLLQHISRKNDIYYLADQQEVPLKIKSLADEISRHIPEFNQVTYPSFSLEKPNGKTRQMCSAQCTNFKNRLRIFQKSANAISCQLYGAENH